MYRKLLGIKGTFTDLADYDPTVYRSLKNILDYDGDDIEEVFMQTFQISYTDVFGHVHVHDLKKDADRIFVNHSNKKVCLPMTVTSPHFQYEDLISNSNPIQFAGVRRPLCRLFTQH